MTRTVTSLEVVEDFSASAKCDEGFLHMRRLRVKNRREDGTSSPVYRVDMVDRPRLDAVAVVIYRRVEGGLEVLTREVIRPAAYFRKDKVPAIPDERSHLFVEEIVAGVLEDSDRGESALLARAAAETFEEAGIEVDAASVEPLGGPIFLAPGILSEKVFLTAVDVTGRPEGKPRGDGSPLEEGGRTRWRSLDEALAACHSGELQDAKSEVGFGRLSALRR